MNAQSLRTGASRARALRPELSGLEDRTLLSTGLPGGISGGGPFIAQVYADLLGRPADNFGLTNFLPLAESGPEGRLDVVDVILGSDEYRSIQIEGLYSDLLDRSPDDFGRAAFDEFLQRPGNGIFEARAIVFGSPEYFETRGGGSNEGFLRALWTDGLRRGIGEQALETRLGQLDSGTPRSQIVDEVLSGTVARELLIEDSFADLLFRAPDDFGRTGFLAALDRGMSEEVLIGTILTSPEYFDAVRGLDQDIVGLASGAEDLSTLVTAVQAAGLAETLQGFGPFTVFAPTNEAFAALPAGTIDALLADPDMLANVLLYHVVPGSFSSPRVVDAGTLTTAEGAEIGIRSGESGPTINGAGLVATDLRATNGVVHLIDQVLLPPSLDIVGTAVDAGSFSTLATALGAADLVETLQGPGPFTVFAPTDAAFAALPDGALDGLLADPEQLRSVLLYHVVAGQSLSSADLFATGRVTTAQGATVDVTRSSDDDDNGGLRINESSVSPANLVATNGLIHVIDAVLLPATTNS